MKEAPASAAAEAVECGAGWARLYEPLIARCRAEGVAVLQVKQKFGRLRFYVDTPSAELEREIAAAECVSARICEVCGAEGVLRDLKGVVRTRCDEHAHT